MKFILISINYEVLGLDIQNRHDEDGWYPISDEAYEYAISHNCDLRLNITDGLKERLKNYNDNKNEYDDSDYVVLESDLTNARVYCLSDVISNRQLKNIALCREFIELGVSYVIEGVTHRFSFKLEDQINYRDLLDMNTETVQVKGVEEAEYLEIPRTEFIKLYNKLNYNKYYNLMYVRVLNEYIETLTVIEDIHKMTYEVFLPYEYKVKLDKLLANYRKMYKEG